MGKIRKYIPFFASALLMCLALLIIYPHYQYYIDPDGTAYLTISKRYASGDIQRAINGYWSPWACWLTAGLIRLGWAAIPASVVINALGAIGCLYISQSFFLKFGIMRRQQWLMGTTLAFFLCYAIFWQSFDDLWECFFLLCTLRLMLVEAYIGKPRLWVVCGVLGTLAYFAKAYSFPFFILNTVACTYFLAEGNKRQWVLASLAAVGVMVLCSLPWIWALHGKYGAWTTSTSGSLNMSWYLVGHPQWKEGIDLLLPPAYPDSPYYWEDPWFANGPTPHFWDSWRLLGLQVLRLGLNAWKFLISNLQLSVFFPALVAVAILSLFHKKVKPMATGPIRIVLLSFLLFPLGYLLVNFEARYLWYMVPLGLVLSAQLMQYLPGKWRNIFLILFPVSILIYPAWEMVKMYDEGKQEADVALRLRARGIKGTFTSDALPGIERQRLERLAYFSGCPFYSLATPKFSRQELLKEMRRYHINYYITHNTPGMDMPVDEQGKAFPELTNGGIDGVRVYVVNRLFFP